MLTNGGSKPPRAQKHAPAFIPSSHHLAIALVFLLAVLVRFYHLDGYGLWSDEFVTLMIESQSNTLDLIKTCFEIPQPMPPLYFWLNKLAVSFWGVNEVSLRVLSAACSAAVVLFVYLIGKVLCNFETAILGASLCAINSTQIVYAQNARPYALALLLSSASILAFLKWLQRRDAVSKVGYIVSTSLLFYTHYVFFPVLLVQNLYFFWLQRFRSPVNVETSRLALRRRWLVMQLWVAVALIPLFPHLWRIALARQSLNWAHGLPFYYPEFKNFFYFLNATHLFYAGALTLVLLGLYLAVKGPLGSERAGLGEQSQSSGFSDALVFLMLWYLVPIGLFFSLARLGWVHLFVERYLILSSLATFLLLPAVSYYLLRPNVARTLLLVYLLYYTGAEPLGFLVRKGQLSAGVPGGNEWRETLRVLQQPEFKAPLFLFQSPFIESNQLNFSSNPKVFEYLASPFRSPYVQNVPPDFTLLPVHWWIYDERHLDFKQRIERLIASNGDFTLLCTQEFWEYFQPWLRQQFSGRRVQEVNTFSSSGSLRLKRMRVSACTHL